MKRLYSLLVLILSASRPVAAQVTWPPWSADTTQIVVGRPLVVGACRNVAPGLTSDSIGPLRTGLSVADLARVCPTLRLGWRWDEGIPEPAAAVRFGNDVAVAVFRDTTGAQATVYRIMFAGQGIRTGDGIGPGSHLGDMVARWGQPRMGAAECALYVWFDARPGISWIMEFPAGWDCIRLEAFAEDSSATRLPPDLRAVVGILGR